MASNPGKNMTAKILAVILASILWIYVMNEQNPPIDSTFTVPLETRNVAEGLLLIDSPETVRVKVRGPRSIIAGVLSKDLRAYVDARGLREGRHSLKVYAQSPSSLEVVELNPDNLTLRLEPILQRQLSIEPQIIGNTVSGALVAKATISAAAAVISGPQNQVEAVDKVIAVIDISGKITDYTISVPLLAVNRDGKELEKVAVSPGKVNMSINWVRGPDKKIVDVKPAVTGEMTRGVTLKRITTNPEKLEISGDPEALQKIDFISTEPINLSGISTDTVREVKIQLREGLTAAQSVITVQIAVEVSQ